ncbi:alpha/beta hydrolase [Marinigracilibium pacificum]|uniref:Alpha/beta hydrolase n=1 Tax=Marinigracilibium pacificum TaxID=2729599 RepID=A0A848J1V7_9BACT|nr:alpha/beta hydrolase [Marinigracilibium pacificum]NMM49701.1 alpha/beta hydrolase [Marinigracilibium pacificum]
MKVINSGGVNRIVKCLLINCLFCLFSFFAISQEYQYPRDTSYTIHSAYLKIKKKYPQVTQVSASNPETIFEKRDLVYSFQSRSLKLDFYSPKNISGKTPAILIVFGGGWKSGQKENLRPMAQRLATAGYVCVVPEYRLSPEAIFPAAVYDLKEAIKWIKSESGNLNIDTNKIAVLGCSAGAQLATLVAVTPDNSKLESPHSKIKFSTRVNAMVNIDGIVAFIHPESEEGKVAGEWLGGNQVEAHENWELASPLTHVDSTSPPILYINSSIPRFHAGRDDMIKILQQENIYFEVHTFDNSPHSFWHVNPWFEPTSQLVINFLIKVFEN